MRKNFSGDRDIAMSYVGAANTQLMIMKDLMRLGGLQQLMRTVDYPGGVQVRVAVVFGQEYMSIDVPSEIQHERRAVEVTDENRPEEIGKFITGKFEDTVHTTSSGLMVITRPQPDKAQSPDVVVVGVLIDPYRGKYKQPFYYSSAGGLRMLPLRPLHTGGAPEALSADGKVIIGGVWMDPAVFAYGLPVMWQSSSSPPIGPTVGQGGDWATAVSTNGGYMKLAGGGEWGPPDNSPINWGSKRGTYSTPANQATISSTGGSGWRASSIYGDRLFSLPHRNYEVQHAMAFPRPPIPQPDKVSYVSFYG